jgi:hypothetical protein
MSSEPWIPHILHEAQALVTGDRNKTYGHPFDNHSCTAALFNAWLNQRFPDAGIKLTPADVCYLNLLQKLGRLANSPTHWDSIVDVAGFAANAGACVQPVEFAPAPPALAGQL